MTDEKDALTKAWTENADRWIRAVREGRIASRRAGTDAAILDAIAAREPKRFLDAGCGEGFHVRRVAERTGCEAAGFDASPALIDAARAADPDGAYEVLSYDDLAADPGALPGPFDVIAFNYALFDEDLVPLLSAARTRLARDGAVIIQTLHPDAIGGGDGWRTEDFDAFGGETWTPMPWYFRTLTSWENTIRDSGLTNRDRIEPVAAPGDAPLSLLLVCEPQA
jgi:SAM-dependent methyltransferase